MAFPGKTVCPIYEQPRQAIEFLFGSGVFSIATALDSFPACEQDCLYTNKMPGPLPHDVSTLPRLRYRAL